MKAIIFSDSHLQFNPMMQAIEKEKAVDVIIHAGDMLADVEDLKIMYPRTNIVYVKGNNDFFDRETPEDKLFELEGVKIFLTHGHKYGVKCSTARLAQQARECGADICIFGHTHQRFFEKSVGLTLFNPGCATRSYGVLEIKNGKFDLNIYEI